MIQEKQNGRYKVTLDRPSVDGKRTRIARSFDSLAEAEEFEAKVARRPVAGDGKTVRDAVDLYLEVHVLRLAPSTYNGYAAQRDRYLVGTAFGDTKLDDVDDLVVEAFYRSMFAGTWGKTDGPRDGRLSTNTVRNLHRLLSVAFDEAARARWITGNPAKLARYTFGEAPVPRSDEFYALDEVAAILDQGDRNLVDLVHVAFATGCRAGELAGLRWRDLDLDAGVVRVYGAVTRPKGEPMGAWERKSTKNRRPRIVPIDPATVETLRARLRRVRAQGLRAGVTDLDDVAVFSPSLERDATAPREFGARWRRAARKAGSRMRFHDLRHLNATEQLADGVDVPKVAARNGWADVATLLKTYAHARRGADEASTATLGATWRKIGDARAS